MWEYFTQQNIDKLQKVCNSLAHAVFRHFIQQGRI